MSSAEKWQEQTADPSTGYAEWCGRFRGALEVLVGNPASTHAQATAKELLAAFEQWRQTL